MYIYTYIADEDEARRGRAGAVEDRRRKNVLIMFKLVYYEYIPMAEETRFY